MKLSDYDVPTTTSLILVGPKGSGKSSLVNIISKVFEDDKFASERAQISCMISQNLHLNAVKNQYNCVLCLVLTISYITS